MGNCFGKASSNEENFRGAGRTLGAAPAAPASAPVPASASSPGRRLGSKNGEDNTGDTGDARSAAARAAEERMKAAQGKGGKLSQQLNAQKNKTNAETLAQVSRENRAARDADAAHETRAYN